MKTKLPVKKLKPMERTAWGWFSKYIRLRDSIKTTNTDTHCICVTCKTRTEWKKLHAGHAIGGRNNSILFDERLVNGQCYHCNMPVDMGGLAGNYATYHVWYIETYGYEDFKEKEMLSRQTLKYSYEQLKEISKKYREKYRELLALYQQPRIGLLKITDII